MSRRRFSLQSIFSTDSGWSLDGHWDADSGADAGEEQDQPAFIQVEPATPTSVSVSTQTEEVALEDAKGASDSQGRDADGFGAEEDVWFDSTTIATQTDPLWGGSGDGFVEIDLNESDADNGDSGNGQSEISVAVPVPEEQLLFPPSPHLRTYFNLMYYFGLAPFDGNSRDVSVLHTVLFGFICTFSLGCYLGWEKQYILRFVEIGNIYHYIQASYFLSRFFISAYFMGLLWLYSNTIKTIIHISLNPESSQISSAAQSKISKIAVWCVATSFLTSLSYAFSISWYVHKNWTVEDIFLFQSETFSYELFLWPGNNVTKSAAYLESLYGEELTVLAVIFAILQVIAEFFYTMMIMFSQDLFLLCALYLHQLTETFNANLKCLLAANGHLTWENIETLYKQFKYIHDVSLEIDNVFGACFKLNHLTNLLFTAYFLLELLNGRFTIIDFATNLILWLKLVSGYYYAYQASQATYNFESAVSNAYGALKQLQDVDLKQNIMLLLSNIQLSNIGIGQGHFWINGTFIYAFSTMQSSIFLFFWNSAKNK